MSSNVKVSVGSPEEAVELFEERAEESAETADRYADPEIEKTYRITQRERLKRLHEARSAATTYRSCARLLRSALDRQGAGQ